ncbi:hypothetical protein MD484_g8337, partial [Candolleomyces efflorescens]
MHTRSSTKKAQPGSSLDRNLEEQKSLVTPELGEAISLEDDAYPRSLYHDIAPESAIGDFLKKSRSYSWANRRWKLPRSCTKLLNEDYYTPFLNVLSSILKHFWNDSTAQGSRTVVDTHLTDLPHCERNPTTHSSRPTFVIKAEGPSFQLADPKPGRNPLSPGFSNITTCIDLQLQHNAMPVAEQLLRLAIYARQIFMHQPNRRFVRLLALSESHLRLFHFDRSGVQYSPCIDFHDDPYTFVRLILGLSSLNESDIGLDASIQWEIVNGRKIGGTLTTPGAEGANVAYPLLSVEPFFTTGSLCGRSTICWSVRDPASNEELVVKDSWKSEEHPSEHIYLQDAVGIPGVAQMISFEHDRDQTKRLRGFGDFVPQGFHNRIETRIVMKAYGKSLRYFHSARQLLCALRDAIAGHQKIHKKGTLHRDISIYNILLGRPGAHPGYRGILIDFDMACHYGLKVFNTPEHWVIGTRHFQSVAVLRHSEFEIPLPRDHLDDLESFFYVLAHILFTYDPQGALQPLSPTVQGWDNRNPGMAATLKQGFLTWNRAPIPVRQRWPIPCSNLLLAYQAFLCPLVSTKVRLNEEDPVAREVEARAFVTNVDQHYAHVLRIFDEAINMLDEPPETWKLTRPDSPLLSPGAAFDRIFAFNPSDSPPQSPNPLKRVSDDHLDGQPPAKRRSSPRRSHGAISPNTRNQS